MKYRSLLFDWSGTLVDDLPPTLYATNMVLGEHNLPALDREEFRQRFRLPYPEFYEEVLPGVPIETLEDTFRTSFNLSPKGVTVLPHAREMLDWCRNQEIRCFVLSSMDVGLLWTAYQRDISRQYLPIQRRLEKLDLLNKWTVPIGSAVFAIPGGVQGSELIAEPLFS